jgi:EAL and modified HD-GYP domain-containing signal transduction protein
MKAGLVEKAGEAFLIGLFSLIEALVDRPMAKVLAELNLNSDITDALLRKPGKLTSILEVVIAYEQATWEKFDLYLPMIGLKNETVGKLYLEALGWVAEIERQD